MPSRPVTRSRCESAQISVRTRNCRRFSLLGSGSVVLNRLQLVRSAPAEAVATVATATMAEVGFGGRKVQKRGAGGRELTGLRGS